MSIPEAIRGLHVVIHLARNEMLFFDNKSKKKKEKKEKNHLLKKPCNDQRNLHRSLLFI